MPGRTIIIGDIHGCTSEFSDLLDKIGPSPEDEVILLGDLINRGPDSHGVVRIAAENQFRALVGNHELRLLTYHARGDSAILKDYDRPTLACLTEEDWQFLRTMIPFVRHTDGKHLLVHGGLIPGRPVESLSAEELSTTKRLRPEDLPLSLRRPSGDPVHWSEVWKGPETVVYGHTPRLSIDHQDFAIGIDTGCVYGGYLTALVLPDERFVQVRAKKTYA